MDDLNHPQATIQRQDNNTTMPSSSSISSSTSAPPSPAPPLLTVSMMDQHSLRKLILQIQQNPDMDGRQKAMQIQNLMMSNAVRSVQRASSPCGSTTSSTDASPVLEGRSASVANSPTINNEKISSDYDTKETHQDSKTSNFINALPEASSADKQPTFAITEAGVLGCPHYVRKCKIFASCCHKWFTCHHCHDESRLAETKAFNNESMSSSSTSVMHGDLDRNQVKYMMCMLCWTIQPLAQNCTACNQSMASYFCSQCRLWHDVQKTISMRSSQPSLVGAFHCKECGICRRGARDNYRHCSRCNACIDRGHFKDHKCIERTLDSDCPICGEHMFTSTRPIRYGPKCGHPIHDDCYQSHVKSGHYQCPVCSRSICDTSLLFAAIDRMLTQEQMPEEYSGRTQHILCNDCGLRSIVSFHFAYHKCPCGSYNTKPIEG